MSCTQTKLFLPTVKFGATYHPSRPSYTHPSRLTISAISKGQGSKAFPRFVCSQKGKQRFAPLCSAIGNQDRENKGFPWESSKETMGEERSIQDLLREHSGNGGRPGGGGGGGGGDGSGGQGDESLSETMDEIMQVVLATIGFIFVYLYLIRGAELTRLARDYIKYLLGGTASIRLTRTMEKWANWYSSIATTVDVSNYLVKKVAASTPTLWHHRWKLAELVRYVKLPTLWHNTWKLAVLMRSGNCSIFPHQT